MESVIFPAEKHRMRSLLLSFVTLTPQAHNFSHRSTDPSRNSRREGTSPLLQKPKSCIPPALALPINMPNRHTGTLPNPVLQRCRALQGPCAPRWRTQEMTPSSMTTTKTEAIRADCEFANEEKVGCGRLLR